MIQRRLVSRPISTVGTLIAPNRTQQQGPPISTNGLVLNVDAYSPYSYSGSGTNWASIHGGATNHDVTLVNGPAFVTDGYGSFDFDGTDDRGEIANFTNGDFNFGAVSGNTNDFAIETCVYHDSTTGSQNYYRHTNETANSAFLLRMDTTKVRFSYYNATGTVQVDLTTTTTIQASRWYHIMATRVGGLHSIFLNGISDASTTNNTATAVAPLTAFPVCIGALVYTVGSFEHMNGKIAFVRVYKGATLTPGLVFQNFQATRWRFGI